MGHAEGVRVPDVFAQGQTQPEDRGWAYATRPPVTTSDGMADADRNQAMALRGIHHAEHQLAVREAGEVRSHRMAGK